MSDTKNNPDVEVEKTNTDEVNNDVKNSTVDNDNDKVENNVDDQIARWKQHARTWEDRAKQNEAAAAELKKIQDANKSDLEKAIERAEKAEKELSEANHRATVATIATEFGLSAEDADLFLTGSTEDILRSQAKKLSERINADNDSADKDRKVVIPGIAKRNTDNSSTSEEEWLKSLFGKN